MAQARIRSAKSENQRASELEQDTYIYIRLPTPLKGFIKKWGAVAPGGMKEATAARFALEVFRGLIDELGDDFWLLGKGTSGYAIGSALGAKLRASLKKQGT